MDFADDVEDIFFPGKIFFNITFNIMKDFEGFDKYRKPTLNGRTTLNGVQCVHIIVYSVEMGGRIQSIFFCADSQHDSQQSNSLTKNAYALT